MSTFKVGQKVLRKIDLEPFQVENWERQARKRGVEPYAPVEIHRIDDFYGDLYIKEMGQFSQWKAANFIPATIDKELEDYL